MSASNISAYLKNRTYFRDRALFMADTVRHGAANYVSLIKSKLNTEKVLTESKLHVPEVRMYSLHMEQAQH
jgi:hypothetical protein